MKANNNPKRTAGVTNKRSYFDWDSNMQIIRKGNGEIAMTASKLMRFFGVTWGKLNHRLQTIVKSSNLHLNEKWQVKKKLSMGMGVLVIHHFIRSQQSLPCPFCLTARKYICSESIFVRNCRNLHP